MKNKSHIRRKTFVSYVFNFSPHKSHKKNKSHISRKTFVPYVFKIISPHQKAAPHPNSPSHQFPSENK